MLNDGSEEAELQESNVFEVQRLREVLKECLEALETCVLQIEYLHEKFQETGSGNATMTSAIEAIRKAKEKLR